MNTTPDTASAGTVDQLRTLFVNDIAQAGGIPRRYVDDVVAVVAGDERVLGWDPDYLELLLDATEGLTVADVRAAAADGFGTGLPILDDDPGSAAPQP